MVIIFKIRTDPKEIYLNILRNKLYCCSKYNLKNFERISVDITVNKYFSFSFDEIFLWNSKEIILRILYFNGNS